jgi:hypothetical protein
MLDRVTKVGESSRGARRPRHEDQPRTTSDLQPRRRTTTLRGSARAVRAGPARGRFRATRPPSRALSGRPLPHPCPGARRPALKQGALTGDERSEERALNGGDSVRAAAETASLAPRTCVLARFGTVWAGNVHTIEKMACRCGLSFKSDEARCTATTAPLCPRSGVLAGKWRWYQPRMESTNRCVTAPSSGAS